MAGRRKPTPIEVFEMAIADADHLVALVEGFTNQRKRRMRKELRDRVGDALKVRVADRQHLDCIESDDVFVVFKPAGRLCRDDFIDGRPLRRQALVAACAAFETYLADKAMSRVGPLLKSEATLTQRLRELPLTLADWMKIDQYERKRWGLREYVVEPAVREMASTAPNHVGALLSLRVVTWPAARRSRISTASRPGGTASPMKLTGSGEAAQPLSSMTCALTCWCCELWSRQSRACFSDSGVRRSGRSQQLRHSRHPRAVRRSLYLFRADRRFLSQIYRE